MLKRVLLAVILLLAGLPMLERAESAPLGVLLLTVGVTMLALPTYLRRSRTS